MKPYKRISVPTARSYLRRNGPENLEELRCESEECQWYLDTAFKPLMKSCQKIRSMHILDREYNNYPIASAENGTLKHSNIANEKGTIKGMRSELFQIGKGLFGNKGTNALRYLCSCRRFQKPKNQSDSRLSFSRRLLSSMVSQETIVFRTS